MHLSNINILLTQLFTTPFLLKNGTHLSKNITK